MEQDCPGLGSGAAGVKRDVWKMLPVYPAFSIFSSSCWSGKRSAGAICTGIFKFEIMTLHLAKPPLPAHGSQCWGKPGRQPRKARLQCARGREPQGAGTAHPAVGTRAHSPASACTSLSPPNLLLASPPEHTKAQGSLAASPACHKVTSSVAHGGRWQWDPPKAEHADGQAAPGRDTCFSKGRGGLSAALPRLSGIQGLSGVN